ncbi:hypothetical protein A9Z42_0062530 [Trichoderma parareesei]|uniref:Uncharacterized protein n=1 Tax=Trichoderma parareesei TaxID=858221 RepID=A0A2H2ZF89_TRIPA|nr:hypothetical protein A9Z42_0062530 [Trichoderma parareesei]
MWFPEHDRCEDWSGRDASPSAHCASPYLCAPPLRSLISTPSKRLLALNVCATQSQRREGGSSKAKAKARAKAKAPRYGLMTPDSRSTTRQQAPFHAHLCAAVTDPSWKFPLVFVSGEPDHSTRNSIKQLASPLRSFGESRRFMHGARSRLGVSLLPRCRPLAAGPSDRWTAADLLQRLSSLHPQPGRQKKRGPWLALDERTRDTLVDTLVHPV